MMHDSRFHPHGTTGGGLPRPFAGLWQAVLEIAPRRSRCCLAGVVMGLVLAAVMIERTETPGARHAELYRPGGMDVHQAGAVLAQDARTVDGCLPAGAVEHGSGQRAELSRLFEILSRSATGREVLHQAALRGVHICLDERTHLLAYYFSGVRVVGVNSALSEGGKIGFLAHELAHVPQHPAYSDNRYYPAEDLVLLRRVREASAEAIAIRIAWELRQAGYQAAWDEKAATSYRDILRTFETAATFDPSEEGELSATRAAFNQWFRAPWRLRVYDRMTVAHLERISDDALGLVPPRYALSHGFLSGIGWLNGANFLAGTRGLRLTDSFYAGPVSVRLAGRIRRLLDQARAPFLPLDSVSFLGAFA